MKTMIFCSISLFFILIQTYTADADRDKEWRLVRTQGAFKRVLIDKSREKDVQVYQQAIRYLCKPNDYCFIQFWSDLNLIPSKAFMTDAQADAMVADYSKNPKTGHDQLIFNCKKLGITKKDPKYDPKKCF